MERHPNKNGFTWKRMKPTVFITAQLQECHHDGFQSQRGCIKHVNTKHSWFFYFDEKPDSKEIDFAMENTIQDQASEPKSMPLSYFPRFHRRVILAKYLQSG